MNRLGLWTTLAFVLVVLGSSVLGVILRAGYAPEWLQYDTTKNPRQLRAWAVEADCYSQLARVQRILHGQGLVQNHFTVENWPEGLVPSTTAPFDYVILLVYAPLKLVTQYPLDWAGAIVSPLLWLALVIFWATFRPREFNRVGRALFLIGVALLPDLVWATAFGRPRHQSLILVLMALGLTAEYERWNLALVPKRAWAIFAGLVWGMACWTSLFEPALVVTVLVAYNLVVRRKESPAFLVSFGVVLLVALLVEGIHVYVPPPEYRPYLANWLGTVEEMQGVSYPFLDREIMFFLLTLALPFMAWGLLKRGGDYRTDGLLLLVTTVLIIFTMVQIRWTPYACLAEILLVVRFCQVGPKRWTCILVMVVFIFGILTDEVTRLKVIAEETSPNQPSQQLEQLAHVMDAPGGIMAPWWLSPGLLYFSGNPIVTGSSHCGISGNVAGAKFYTARSWTDAERILKERKVRWVVVYSDTEDMGYPLLKVERGILGLPDYTDDTKIEAATTVEQILAQDRFVPTSLRLRSVTPQLLLYEYVPE